jgi:chromosomal replication initiation ATPase DnaA
MSQLIFQFDTRADYSHDNFLLGENNRAAYDFLGAWPNWPSPVAILVGAPGVGKTYLLQIWQAHAKGLICPVHNLQDGFNPLRYATVPSAVDDADQVAGQIGRERALLHLYNLALQNKQTLLLAAQQHPQHWQLLLPDLASRLRSAMVIEVGQPDETMMRQLYQKLFADRQLVVPGAVIDWLLLRVERSATTAQQVAAVLDAAALEHQRPITVFLARKVLGMEDDGEIQE